MHRIKSAGFTIIELLVVIVVIAILAAITVVAYTGVTKSAEETAIASGLRNVSTQLSLHKLSHGDKAPASLTEEMLSAGGNAELEYTRYGDYKYCLSAFSSRVSGVSMHVTDDGKITEGHCPGHVQLADTNSSCFAFNASNNTITDYYNHEGNNSSNPACPRDVGIPSHISGVEVKTIGMNAFYYNQLTSVSIPDTVTKIGLAAFQNNLLTQVVIPESVNVIDINAFNTNQLTSVNIPSAVTNISMQAFYNNKLESVEIPSSVKTISTNSFTRNNISSLSIPRSVTSIAGGAFNNNKMPDSQAFIMGRNSNGSPTGELVSYAGEKRAGIVIPSNVTTIGYNSFNYIGNITSVTIPNTVTAIAGSAFADNKLTSITIPNSVASIDTFAFLRNNLTSVNLPNSVTTLGLGVFRDNKLTSISLPSSLTSMGDAVFTGNLLPDAQAFIMNRDASGNPTNEINSYAGAKRSGVVIPGHVKRIGNASFSSMNLTSVTIPNGVTHISNTGFYNNKLTSVTIPSSVVSIGSLGFRSNQLTSVSVPSATTVADGAFDASVTINRY